MFSIMSLKIELLLSYATIVLTTANGRETQLITQKQLGLSSVPGPTFLANCSTTSSVTAQYGIWKPFMELLDLKISSYEIQKTKMRAWRLKSSYQELSERFFKGTFIKHCKQFATTLGITDLARCSDLNYVDTSLNETENFERCQLTRLFKFHRKEPTCSFNSTTNTSTVAGNFLVLSEIMKMECLHQPFSVLVVVAYEKLFIDSDIVKDRLNSSALVKLFLIAPEWDLHEGSRTIDLSGEDGRNHTRKAGVNQPGLAGLPGDQGGIFIGIVSEIIGGSLKVIANGGKGGRGQDGGTGLYGAPGSALEVGHIKCEVRRRLFTSLAKITESVYKYAGPVQPKKCIRPGSKCEWYAFGGTQGQPGRAGRDGGDAGAGGAKGFVGIFGKHSNFSLEIITNDGDNGDPGRGGDGGLGGTVGVYKIVEISPIENTKCVIKILSDNEVHGPATILEFPKLASVVNTTARAESGKAGSWGELARRVASGPPNLDIFGFVLQKLVSLRIHYMKEYNHPFRLPPIAFLTALDQSAKFVTQIPIDVFFTMLFQAEESLKEEGKEAFVAAIYQSLQRQLEVAKEHAVGQDHETIEFLLAATYSRLLEINNQDDYVLITDVKAYLESAIQRVDKLLKIQEKSAIISAIGELEKINNDGIEEQGEEIRETITNTILPLIDSLKKDLETEMHSFSQDLQREQQTLETERKMESSIPILRAARTTADIIARVLGKVASKTGNTKVEIGSVVSGFAAVALEHVESIGPTQEVDIDHSSTLKQKYHMESKNLLQTFIASLHKTKLGIPADQYLNKTYWKLEGLSKNFTESLNSLEATDLVSKTAKMEANRLHETQTGLKNSARDLLDFLRREITQLEAQITDMNQVTVQSRIKILNDTILKFSGSELYKSDSKAATRSDNQDRTERYLKIEKAQADLEQTAQSFLESFSGGFLDTLQNRSATQTDVMSAKLWDTFDKAVHVLQQISSGLHETNSKDIELIIKRLRHAVSTLAAKYHNLAECQNRLTLNSYLAKLNVVNHCREDLTNPNICKNKFKVHEILFANTIRRFSSKIYDYIKIWTFPFTQALKKVQHLVHEGTVRSMSQLLRLLNDHVTSYDSGIHQQDFVLRITEHYEYFTWNGEHNLETFRRLLAGKTVILDADICRSNKYHDAVKFSNVTLKFTTMNPKAQELLQSLSSHKIYMYHTGRAHFRYREKYYSVLSNPLLLSHSVWSKTSDYSNSYFKLSSTTPVLSPYTLWKVQICKDGCKDGDENKLDELERLQKYSHLIDISLVGSGSYVEGTQQNVDEFFKPIDIDCS